MTTVDFMKRFEEDGLHLFELLAYDTENAELRTTFNVLATTQRRHLADLQAIARIEKDANLTTDLMERTCSLTNGFARLLECHDIHKEMRTDPDAFWHIVNAEQEFIRLLEGIAHAETDRENRNLLQRLVSEEKTHLEKIENIYDFIKTPHTYLEWGEFSNLHAL